MGHTPFGYRIENGKAVIDEAAAAQVRDLCKNYLGGLPYQCCKGSRAQPTPFWCQAHDAKQALPRR